MPAEWTKHKSVWLAWPSHKALWQDNLESAQEEFTAFATHIADEKLNVLVPEDSALKTAEAALRGLNVDFHKVPFGDIWLRDTAPIVVKNPGGERASLQFQFNGWGGKYILEYDNAVRSNIARLMNMPTFSLPFVLEGGAVEVDGEGTCLTSKSCLLNPNRNSGWTVSQIEAELKKTLGVQKVLWVTEGLLNDHTDGHIDTIARFIAPGKVMCMRACKPNDPNGDTLQKIHTELESMIDGRGRKLEVISIPSPHKVLDDKGKILPASYLNFYISNKKVIVPIYESEWDEAAVEAIAEHFSDRETVGLTCKSILTGGGAFHCISQQEPE